MSETANEHVARIIREWGLDRTCHCGHLAGACMCHRLADFPPILRDVAPPEPEWPHALLGPREAPLRRLDPEHSPLREALASLSPVAYWPME